MSSECLRTFQIMRVARDMTLAACSIKVRQNEVVSRRPSISGLRSGEIIGGGSSIPSGRLVIYATRVRHPLLCGLRNRETEPC